MIDADTPLAGLRFPDGSYTVTSAANARLCRLVGSPPLHEGVAHPAWGHLATHIGKSVSFTRLAEILDAPLDAGFLFGGGTLEYADDIALERDYIVRGGIDSVEARVGRRTGSFDIVTTGLELVERDTGSAVSRSRESYIVPRPA